MESFATDLFKAMQISRLIDKYDLLLTDQFLDGVTCRQIIAEAQASEAKPALVYGQGDSGRVEGSTRRASHLKMPETTVKFIHRKLLDHAKTIERHFSRSLSNCELPQFLRYDLGDFFVAHQDGNTGLVQLESDAERKISIVIFLNQQSDIRDPGTYSGGSLKFSDYRAAPGCRELCLPADAGTMVAFRSELTHEVTPITHGVRYTIVSWYR